MEQNEMTLLILAGGKSSRMGEDKRYIELGHTSMLEILLKKAIRQRFAQIYLCVERKSEELLRLAEEYEAELILDTRQEAGPMEGLRAGLSAMQTEYAVALSCDLPLFVFPVLQPLMDVLKDEKPVAVLAETKDRKHPLTAIYHKSLAEKLDISLSEGKRRLMSVIDQVPHRLIKVEEHALFNVNTPAELRLIRGRLANFKRATPLVTISAPASNTGKTTFIERVIPRLRAEGLKVGVVKGDAHGYQLDNEGKDSWRFSEAGADSVAVVSPDGYFIERKTSKRVSLISVAEQLEGVDVVLIESRNHGTFPKLSLWRDMGEPILDEDTVAVFSSKPKKTSSHEEYSLDDIESAVRLILFLVR